MTTRNCRNQDLDLLIMTQIVKYNGQNRNSIHFRTEILEKILFGGGWVDFAKSKSLKTTG